VVEINENLAVCDFWGVKKQVRLEIVDEPVKVGDYILNHVGYAIRRIPEESITDTLALYELLMREMDLDDAMVADVRGEIAGTGNA
jgi:hydrogenase expression/formation protein HypC